MTDETEDQTNSISYEEVDHNTVKVTLGFNGNSSEVKIRFFTSDYTDKLRESYKRIIQK